MAMDLITLLNTIIYTSLRLRLKINQILHMIGMVELTWFKSQAYLLSHHLTKIKKIYFGKKWIFLRREILKVVAYLSRKDR